MKIPDEIGEEILNYCKSNNISDIDSFINRIINRGFSFEKYNNRKPTNLNPQEKEEQKESEVTEVENKATQTNNNVDIYKE